MLRISTLLVMILLSACNTVGGVGKDMEAAGDSLHNKAEEHKSY